MGLPLTVTRPTPRPYDLNSSVDTHGQSPWHFTGQASLDLNPGVPAILHTRLFVSHPTRQWKQNNPATILPALSNILFLTTQTFPLTYSPYIALPDQPPHLPHTSAESPLTDEHNQPEYSTQVSLTPAYLLIPWGKVCLYTTAHQDSGYGGGIFRYPHNMILCAINAVPR